MTDDNTLDARGPGHKDRPNVRDQVLARYVVSLPPVRLYLRYRQDCIDAFRHEHPDLAWMTDADAWEFTKARPQ